MATKQNQESCRREAEARTVKLDENKKVIQVGFATQVLLLFN